ncbi:ABC transporter ATP-binding protein [Helcococcus kunzii]|uniref:ABC transporter ATP-binding protein n=1 Tax=Helcococcus kunzii TaxID=40091 RepID=UPI001BAED673|nr:ABC transporter ATP-binding protein [Helcococcus kunzii]QUY64541.1 ABC transporter ATP-binding protein [Helcococcus kunzii]QZO76954.1 ABC transporter ATP-binding protein [Helcococcus kunzii]
MINIKKLNKYYNKGKDNELHVLKDLNLLLSDNEYIAIMGTSGVGKSTLLNIIGGLETFESGIYEFCNKDMSNLKENELSEIRGKEISFIFQDYMLIEQDNILKNVKVPLYFDKRYKLSDFNSMAKNALKKVGLEDIKTNKKVSQLSGGQKQRVAIARAIVNKPKLLLADEPTGAVDAETAEEILLVFDELIKNGLSIILVTHDINVAKRANKIYKMIDGSLYEDKDV